MPTARAKILRHAQAAFLEAPYIRVSVREIAARSGFSHTYVHQLFGNKRDIFKRVCEDATAHLRGAVNLQAHDTPMTTVLKMLSVDPLNQPIVRIVRKAVSDRDMYEALLEGRSPNPDDSLLMKVFEPLFKSGSSHPMFEGASITPAAFATLGLCIIWAVPAADMLSRLTPEQYEMDAAYRAAPQELLLHFITALGHATTINTT